MAKAKTIKSTKKANKFTEWIAEMKADRDELKLENDKEVYKSLASQILDIVDEKKTAKANYELRIELLNEEMATLEKELTKIEENNA